MSRVRPLVLVLLATAAAACGTSGGDEDATPSADSGVHPDAIVVPADTGVHPDAPSAETGTPSDATPGDAPALDVPDAEADAGFLDAAPIDTGPDAGPPDSGACGPIPRATLCAQLTPVIGAYLARCNPELAASEALALAGAVCSIPETPFTDTSTSVAYAAAAAGACACEIERLPCDSPDPFLTIASCAAVFTGTIAEGNRCLDDHRCAPGTYCRRALSQERFPGPLTLAFREPRCPGECTRFAQPGEACVLDAKSGEQARCVPTHGCDVEVTRTCVPLAQVGRACDRAPCAGSESAIGPPAVECIVTSSTATVATCAPKARANQRCDGASCHPLYRCGVNLTCEARARPTQACAMRSSTSSTTVQGRRQALQEARDVCLNPLQFGITTGQLGAFTCVETAGTPGRGVCRPEPTLGQMCGIGPGVTPHCARGTRCTAVNPVTFAPVVGTCEAAIPEGDLCSSAWDDATLSPQCAAGACFLQPDESTRCMAVPMCESQPIGT